MKTSKIGDIEIKWHDDGSVSFKQDSDFIKVKRDILDDFITALDQEWTPVCVATGCNKSAAIMCPNCREEYCGGHYVAHPCTQQQPTSTGMFPNITPQATSPIVQVKCRCGWTIHMNGSAKCLNCGSEYTVC